MPVIPPLRNQVQEDQWGLPASQLSLVCDLRVRETLCLKQNKEDGAQGMATDVDLSGLHMKAHTQEHSHAWMQTCKSPVDQY